ncbi:MAG: DUF4369 domain-containing protein [Butyricimonas faecihominis]
MFLMLNDINQPYAIDSTQISNGKFLLEGKFDIPRYCSVLIYLDPNNRSDRSKLVNFSLFLDSTAVKAVCDNSGRLPCSAFREATHKMLSKIIQIRYNLFKPIAKTFTAYTKPITMVTT